MKRIHTRLTVAGQASRDAAEQRAKAAEELRAAVRLADEAGMSKTQIAEVAGINRVTVHGMLKGDK